MKILTFSKSPWDDSNSTGNTFSNLFSGYDKKNIAHFYLRDSLPNNSVCTRYFSLSEKMLLKSFFSTSYIPGDYFEYNPHIENNDSHTDEQIYSFFRTKNLVLPHIFQNLYWIFNEKWKNKKVRDFLRSFQPDIIFIENLESPFLNKILWYLQKKSKAKVVIFHTDDYLTVNNNKSFLEKKFIKYRAKLEKESCIKADLNYGISNELSDLYLKKTGKSLNTLYKGAVFDKKPSYKLPEKNITIKITYIGSILYGRWKTLSLLAKKINEINKNGTKFELNIFSQFELTEEMERHMIIEGTSNFLGKVSPDKVKEVYKESDIVLHVESFDKIEKLNTQYSFSTKIVDLLNSGKPIMAIGWEEAASISYLESNNAALVANSSSEIKQILHKIIENKDILSKFANAAWECGLKNHQLTKIQKKFYEDLELLVKENRDENITN